MLHCPRDIMRTVAYSGIFLAAGLAPAFAADPTGDWRVADGVANIRVAECNGRMWGVGGLGENPGGHDTNNPDASKQNRPTLGMPILLDMKKKAGARSVGRPSLQRQGRPRPTVPPSSRSVPTSLRSRAACSASSAAAKPGPGSRLRFRPARSTAWPRAAKARRRPPSALPKTVGAANDRLRRRPPHRSTRKCPAKSSRRRAAGRPGRRYLPTPRHRAVCPLARAGTTTPRPAS